MPTVMIITVTLNPTLDRILEVPGFRVGVHARARLLTVLPDGKGNNVARGVARLGGRALAVSFVGRNEEAFLARSLEAEGIQVRLCPVEGETRTSTTIVDPVARTSTHLRETGFEVAPADVEGLGAMLADCLAGCGGPCTMAFCGSLPPGMALEDFAALLKSCAARGGRIVVDANGPALRAAIGTGMVNTFKPNLEELRECLGEPLGREQALPAARRLLDRVRTVLLTLGAEGAFLVREGLTIGRRCPLRNGELRSAVGCGDAFLAGWLWAEEMGKDASEALSWAVAAGAAAATSELTVGYSLDDVQRLLPRCEDVRPL
jgi:1-phosphofructokinase